MPGTTPSGHLHRLLVEMFDTLAELRTFLGRHLADPSLLHALPDPSVCLVTYAHEAIRAMEKRALLDLRFFQALVSERPRRAAEVSRIEALVLGRTAALASEDATAPATSLADGTNAAITTVIIRLRDVTSLPIALDSCGISAPSAGSLLAYPEGTSRQLRLRSTGVYINPASTPGRGAREVALIWATGAGAERSFSWGPFHAKARNDEHGNWTLSFQDRRTGARRDIQIIESERSP